MLWIVLKLSDRAYIFLLYLINCSLYNGTEKSSGDKQDVALLHTVVHFEKTLKEMRVTVTWNSLKTDLSFINQETLPFGYLFGFN